jgi:MFS transporter, PPP family, 3-phenylpropionic acid transporter
VTQLRHLNPQMRLSILYALLLTGAGASLPFMPVWFKDNGMSPEEIAIILAVPHLMRAISGPLIGIWADRFSSLKSPIIILGLLGGLFYASLWPGEDYGAMRFFAFLALWTLGYSCSSFVNPLMDSLNLRLSRVSGFNYGFPRAMGSVAFVVANIVVGAAIVIWNSQVILIFVAGSMIIAAIGAKLFLSEETKKPSLEIKSIPKIEPQTRSALKGKLKSVIMAKGFIALILAIGLLQASHSFYYAYSTIIWKQQGFSEVLCGLLWATGVAAEIGFMIFGARFRHDLGPWRLLVLAAVVSVTRWVIMIMGPPLFVVFLLQIGHLFTFAAVYMAGLEIVPKLLPPQLETLGQTIHASYANGVFMGLGTLFSGWAFGVFADKGYAMMALLSLTGLLIATWLYNQNQNLAPKSS